MNAFAAHQADSNAKVQHQLCAMVLHGLNTHPGKMADLAHLLEQHSFKTKLGILTGHSPTPRTDESISAEQWKNDFRRQWTEATSNCANRGDSSIFVGYSLGAVVGLSLFDSDPSIHLPDKIILIAPALEFRLKVSTIKAISWFPWGSLPSLNHSDYRARSWTPIQSYQALFQLQKEWKKNAWKKTGSIHTLVALNADDELVDSQKLQSEINNAKLQNWATIWLSNSKSLLRPNYHHLIIDKLSLGDHSWEQLRTSISALLNSGRQITK